MGDAPFHLKDPSRIHSFVMPSPRVPMMNTSLGGGGLQFPHGLFQGGHGPSGLVDLGGLSGSVYASSMKGVQVPFGSGLFLGPSGGAVFPAGGLAIVSDVEAGSMAGAGCVQLGANNNAVVVPGWAIRGGYALCGLSLCLCNLLAPGYIQECAHMMCPLWTLSMGLHIACGAQHQQYGSCWVWSGVLTLLLLPFVIMVGSPLFVGFFLLVFALFSSVFFWRRLQGASFILAWLCWAGLLFAFTLSMGVVVPPHMHLCVAAFFSISLGVLNSGGGKYLLRLG